jgi:hypothetical protein
VKRQVWALHCRRHCQRGGGSRAGRANGCAAGGRLHTAFCRSETKIARSISGESVALAAARVSLPCRAPLVVRGPGRALPSDNQ